jgi:hypothetical protein
MWSKMDLPGWWCQLPRLSFWVVVTTTLVWESPMEQFEPPLPTFLPAMGLTQSHPVARASVTAASIATAIPRMAISEAQPTSRLSEESIASSAKHTLLTRHTYLLTIF